MWSPVAVQIIRKNCENYEVIRSTGGSLVQMIFTGTMRDNVFFSIYGNHQLPVGGHLG